MYNPIFHGCCQSCYQIRFSFLNTKWKIVSEYDQEIPQSQTADNPLAWRGYVMKSYS